MTNNGRYAVGVARVIADERPALIQVYNRAHIARHLIRAFPTIPVILALANDPQDMRAAKTAGERAWLLRHAACVVSTIQYLAARMTDGVPPSQIRRPIAIIANGIDLVALPTPLPTNERERRIVFVGRVTHDKGADSFHPDSPDTAFIRNLRPQTEAAAVTMLGYRDNTEVLRTLASTAIVVMPSRWQEPFGMTAVEAMASGAALITSRRGGLPEAVGEAALFADPEDPADLAAAITALATDPARRARLGQAGLARARQFDLALRGSQFNTLIRSILAERWSHRLPAPIYGANRNQFPE